MTIDEQLRALGAALDDEQAPITAEEVWQQTHLDAPAGGAIRRTLVAAAAAVLLLAGLAGVALIGTTTEPLPPSEPATTPLAPVTTSPAPATTLSAPATTASTVAPPATTEPVLAGFPTGPPANPPSAAPRADVSWWVPTALPDDLSFRHAVDRVGWYRELSYGGAVCSTTGCERWVSVRIDEPAVLIEPSDGLVADATDLTWSQREGDDAWTIMWKARTVTITGGGLTDDELEAVASSTRLLPETALPRTPILCCPFDPSPSDAGPVVASLELPTPGDPTLWELHAFTDGDQFALSGYNQADETPGSFVRVSADRPIALRARPGTYTEPRLPDGTGLVVGVVHPDVATIDIFLADGQTLTHTPVDESGLFQERFVFLTFPFPQDGQTTDVGTQLVGAVARDIRGVEIFRCDSWADCSG